MPSVGAEAQFIGVQTHRAAATGQSGEELIHHRGDGHRRQYTDLALDGVWQRVTAIAFTATVRN